MEQNPQIIGRISGTSRWKGNRIIRVTGAGDGNRTHVRSLGSFYSAIELRPLYRNATKPVTSLQGVRTDLEPRMNTDEHGLTRIKPEERKHSTAKRRLLPGGLEFFF